MKQKILSSLLAVLSLFLLVLPASAAETPTILMDSASEVQIGDTVKINVYIQNNPGISSLNIQVTYPSAFRLERISSGGLFDSAILNENTGKMVFDNGEDVYENGILATLYFRISENILPDEYPIDVTVISCNNFDEQRISCLAIPSSITVICNHSYGSWERYDERQHKRLCACAAVEYGYHVWDAGIVTVPPTATSNGIATYICVLCGETKNEIIPVQHEHKHDYSSWFHDELSHWRQCLCGETADVDYHVWESSVVKPADCINDGEMLYSCLVCGRTKTETISAGHIAGEWEWLKSPDNNNFTQRIQKCSRCGEILVRETPISPESTKPAESVEPSEPSAPSEPTKNLFWIFGVGIAAAIVTTMIVIWVATRKVMKEKGGRSF